MDDESSPIVRGAEVVGWQASFLSRLLFHLGGSLFSNGDETYHVKLWRVPAAYLHSFGNVNLPYED